MKKAKVPVILSLVYAPILDKKEIAEFFKVSEEDFEVENGASEGRYLLTVKIIESAIKMFNSIAENQVPSILP